MNNNAFEFIFKFKDQTQEAMSRIQGGMGGLAQSVDKVQNANKQLSAVTKNSTKDFNVYQNELKAVQKELVAATKRIGDLETKLKQKNAAVNNTSKNLGGLSGAFAGVTRVAGAFGLVLSVQALVQFTRNAINAGDRLNDLAKRYQVSTDALQKFGYAAKLAGADVEDVATSFRFMGQQISQASSSSSAAASLFRQMGIDVKELKALKPEEQFIQIADAISRIEDPADRTNTMIQILGGRSLALAPMMEQGAEGMRKMAEEAVNMGLVLDSASLEKLAKFNDQLDVFTMKATVAAQRGFIVIMEFAYQLYDSLADVISVVSSFSDSITSMIPPAFLQAIMAVVPTIKQFAIEFVKIGLIALAIVGPLIAVKAAVVALWAILAANPIILVIGALAAVITYFGGLSGTIQALEKVWIMFITNFQIGINTMLGFGQALWEGLKAVFDHLVQLIATFSTALVNFVKNPLKGADFSGFNALLDKEVVGAFKEAYGKVKEETESMNKVLAEQGAEKLGKLAQASKEVADAREKEREKTAEAAKALKGKIEIDTEATKKSQEMAQEIESMNKKYKDQIQTFGYTATESDRVKLALFQQSKAWKDLSAEQKKQVKESVDMSYQVEAFQQQEKIFNEQKKMAEDAYNTIVDTGAKTLTSFFFDGTKGFGDMMKSWVRDFTTGVAKMALEAQLKPILMPIITSIVGGGGGQSFGAYNAAGGGGGLSLGNLSSAANLLGVNPTSMLGLDGVGGGIINSVNTWGSNVLGTGTPLPWNPSAAFAGTGSTLTSLLGSVGTGVGIGGLVAGLTGGNSLGGSIGGGLGGLAGNFILPGIGGIIGSALGGFVGGLFGGKKHPAASFDTVIGEDGKFGDITYKSKHMGTESAQKMADLVQQTVNSLVAAGIDVSGERVMGGVDGDTPFFQVHDVGGKISFDANNEQESASAMAQFVVNLMKATDTLNTDMKTALENITTEGRQASEVIADIQFAMNYSKLGEIQDALTASEQQMKQINDQYEQMADTAERLGLEVQKVLDAQDRAIKQFLDTYNNSLQSQLNELVDPMTNSLLGEVQRYNDQLKDAQRIGADTKLVEQIHQQKIMQILNQAGLGAAKLQKDLQSSLQTATNLASTWKNIATNLGNTINSLYLSDLSPLGLQQKRDMALSNYEALKSKGDPDSIAQLGEAARTFLELDRQLNSSNGVYRENFDRIQEELAQAKEYAQRQVSTQEQQVMYLNSQLTQLQQANSSLSSVDGKLSTMTQQIVNGILAASNQQITPGGSIVNGVAVNAGGKSLSDMVASGVTRGEANNLARSLGYTGEFGLGGHSAWLAQDTTGGRTAAYNAAVKSLSSSRGYAFGGLPPIGGAHWVGERGPELRFDQRSMGIQSTNKIQIADDSRVVYALGRVENSLGVVCKELTDIKMASIITAGKETGVNELKNLSRRLEPSKSYWGNA